jgi:formate hydrogenlyase subunit 6/NADH:ubiquinone oxidoreductase subunit I
LLIDPAECIDCAACKPACSWEAIYQGTEVPNEFKEFVQINARITGQTDLERTPKYDKPKPSPEEVTENREKWLAKHR